MAVKIQDLRSVTQRTNGTRAESSIRAIARHHSATTSGNFYSFWDYWHNTKGWGTGGYHEIILRDGTVQICYDPHEITNGVGGHNHYVYNICLVGNGSFTAAQEDAFRERCLLAMKRFNLPVSAVLGHNEFSGTNTTCPGINMDTVRKALKNGNVEAATPPANTGESVVDYLKSKGQPSDFADRAKLAKEYGIKNYTGSPEQNILLLKLLKAGKPAAPKPTPKPTPPKPVEKPKEGERLMKLTSWQKEEMAKIYDKAHEQKIFSDNSHGEKIKRDEMTVEDGIYLATVLAGAAINDPGRVK